MIVKRLYPENTKHLTDILVAQAQGAQCVVVQAGHFLLYYDNTEARLLPGISTSLDSPRHALVAQEIGHYPSLTWKIALVSLTAISAQRKLAMVVVNDWQYLPKEIDRFDFYNSHPTLPPEYQQVLASAPSVQLLRPKKTDRGTGDFFSEQTLRNEYGRHIKELIKQKRLPSHAQVQSGKELTCSLEDSLGGKREIYCSGKRQNCTHEVAELVWTVNDLAHADVFINFFPIVCKEYMIEGTELGYELFQHGLKKVVNIGMQSSNIHDETDIFIGAEVIVHEHN